MKQLLIALSFFIGTGLWAQQITPSLSFDPISVTTLAGTGEAGFADGPASTAKFNTPKGVALAGSDIYIIDQANYRIRKISAAGNVSTFAGSGLIGTADGPASLAQFSNMHSITADRTGNLYVYDVVDINKYAIRKITSAGVVSTLVKFGTGSGNSYTLSFGTGLATDAAGNIYAGGERQILKITPAGIISVFASVTVQQYFQPSYMAFDPQGNLIVQQSGFVLPVKISPAGVVSVVSAPGPIWNCVAIDKNGNIFIIDIDNVDSGTPTYSFCRFSPQGIRTVLAGTSSGYKDGIGEGAQFSYGVSGLAADDAGNVYLPDNAFHRIRKISSPSLHFATSAGIVSAASYFSFSGIALAGPATVQAPAAYEISLNEAGPYSASLTIPTVAGEINSVKIFTRIAVNAGPGTYNDSVTVSAAGAPAKKIDVAAVVSPVMPGKGLYGVYYKGTHFLGKPLLSRIDPTINFELSYAHPPMSPAPGIVPNDSFTVRWSGQVLAPASGTYTFYTNSDDGIRLWVNGLQLVDNWVNQGATERSGTITLVAGQKYDILVEYYEAAGDAVAKLSWSGPGIPKAIIPQSQLFPPENLLTPSSGTGLLGTYFSNVSLVGLPVYNRVDSTINFNLGFSSPVPGIVPVDYYSVRWTGQIEPRYSEFYSFYTTSDDGIRLWVNGVKMIDNWVNQGATEISSSNTIRLLTGKRYDIVIEYYEAGGEAVTKLAWSSPGTPKEIVPKSQLYPPVILPVPPCTVNISPVNGAIVPVSIIKPVVLTWASVQGATGYDFYSWQAGNLLPTYPSITVTDTSMTLNGSTYIGSQNWYVAPRNANGPATGCATTFTNYSTVAEAIPENGLLGTYYKGNTLSGTPLLTRVDPTVNFELTYSHPPLSPAPGIVPEDNFSVRWTGQIIPLYSETYTFYTLSDDGVRLWVNGVLLVDNWFNQGATEKSGSIALVAGQAYNIKMEYFEGTGEAVAKLYWSSASTAKAIIPASQLYPTTNSYARVADPFQLANTASLSNTTESLLTSASAVISPNPVAAGQQVKLQIYSSKAGPVLLSKINSNGIVISSEKLNLTTGVNSINVNTKALKQGFYIIRVTEAGKPFNLKLIIQ